MNFPKYTIAAGLAAATGLGAAGGMLLNSVSASAYTQASALTAASTAPSPPANFDQSLGGHQANGITETLLTGDAAAKAKTAALGAVPGGTVQRVETDAEGAAYEAHMLRSDGTPVTVKMDKDFKVTGTESGPGGPGQPGSNSQTN